MNLGLALFIITLIVFFGGVFLYHIIFPNSRENVSVTLFVVWIVSCIASAMIIKTQYDLSIEYREGVHYRYIYSLGNDKYVEGDFTLGSGTIEEVDYYFFFVKYNSGMKREKLKSDIVYIREGNVQRPYIEAVYTKYRDEDKFWKVMDELEPDYYVMHVPPNTIITDFKVR